MYVYTIYISVQYFLALYLYTIHITYDGLRSKYCYLAVALKVVTYSLSETLGKTIQED